MARQPRLTVRDGWHRTSLRVRPRLVEAKERLQDATVYRKLAYYVYSYRKGLMGANGQYSYGVVAVKMVERGRKIAGKATNEEELAKAQALVQCATVYALLDVADAFRGTTGGIPAAAATTVTGGDDDDVADDDDES